MRMNPFSIADATVWLSLPSLPPEDLEDSAKKRQAEQIQQLARLLDRLLEVTECDPNLYEMLPWLKNMSLWELLVQRKAEARFPDISDLRGFAGILPDTSDEGELDVPDSERPTRGVRGARRAHSARPTQSTTAATLLAFFARVTQPIAEMIEALYLSPLLRDSRTVWEILCRMARAAGIKPLPPALVTAMCANLTRARLHDLAGYRPRPHPAIWRITWRPTVARLRWPGSPCGSFGSSGIHASANENSLLVLVTEEITHKAGIGYQHSGRVLAFRCIPHSPGLRETAETAETAMKLALYDALVFPLSRDGQLSRHICPPTLLRVQPPVPKAIREAARVWGIKVEETERGWESESGSALEAWEKELADRALDPVHYMRILDRGFEKAYGYAPLLTKQRAARQWGWRWRMHPDNDPLLNYAGLGDLLPSFPAVVGDDGTIEWQGWHYRDYEENVLGYFPHAQVEVRPSPLTEAVVLVYWKRAILCYAVADELRHEDGSCRSYWFPYPRLGE